MRLPLQCQPCPPRSPPHPPPWLQVRAVPRGAGWLGGWWGPSCGLQDPLVTGSLLGCRSGTRGSRTGSDSCLEAGLKPPVQAVPWGRRSTKPAFVLGCVFRRPACSPQTAAVGRHPTSVNGPPTGEEMRHREVKSPAQCHTAMRRAGPGAQVSGSVTLATQHSAPQVSVHPECAVPDPPDPGLPSSPEGPGSIL